MQDFTIREILLVEDDPDHALLATRALRQHFSEAHVHVAASAEEGETALAARDWDAVIIDYGLPHANGLQLLQQVSQNWPHFPLVMLTGRGDEQTAVTAMKAGAADYVTKTGDYLALLPAAVETAVRRCRIARDRERLARELEQRNRHLAAVSTVAVAVSRSLRLEEMLAEAVRQVTATTGLPGAVFLPREGEEALHLTAHAGLSAAILDPLESTPLPAHPEAQPPAHAQGESNADTQPVDPRFFPLATDGQPQGVLAIFPEPGRALEESEVEMLSTMAHVIGMGVRNALLFEETRALSLRDELTGLGNRRLFNIRLQSDFHTARRYGTRLALLMLDIDHFKAINDQYGHTAGDAVLASLAQVLLQRSRGSDLAFRYGGEEFALLLPHTSSDAAIRVAERIRRIVADEEFLACGKEIRITVSIGVGSYRETMQSEADLVAAADQALYRAKESGRNRVCTNDGQRVEWTGALAG